MADNGKVETFTATRSASPHTPALAAWVQRIGERRDLSLEPPHRDARSAAIERLCATLSKSFAEFAEVVSSARSAARRNSDLLAAIVEATSRQGELVRATALTAASAVTGSERMASAAAALRDDATTATRSAQAADIGLAEMGGALGELESRLDEGSAPLAEMATSTERISAFLANLARLSRHAQLLAVNASIEAAHLDAAGAGFEIVAQEVRKLAVSTREAQADVARIVKELRSSTGRVEDAAGLSRAATRDAGSDIEGAAETLAQTGRAIAEFEELVRTIADVSTRQREALSAAGVSLEGISSHADSAARSSQAAGRLDLESLVAHAETAARRWTLRADSADPSGSDGDAFAAWLDAIAAGADPAAVSDADADPALRPLVGAVRSLLERVNADARDVLASVVNVAVAVSRNGYAWREIGGAIESIATELGAVRDSVAEAHRGARTSSEIARTMEQLVATIRAQYDTALGSLEGALARIAHITGSVTTIETFVGSMNSAAERAGTIMALIESLSSDTDLLSLNAAIEAAHAGEAGAGFSVIAEEIRSLAQATNEATANVTDLVANVATISATLLTSIESVAAGTQDVTTSAQHVRSAIGELRAAFDAAMQRTVDVAATTVTQSQALDAVLADVEHTADAFAEKRMLTTDSSRVELAMIGSRAHAIAARRTLGTTVERVRAFGERLAVRLEGAYEAAVASGRISLDALFDLRYEEITGSKIATLRRLFDTTRVPQSGFAPPKYATPWDAAVDESLNTILESVYDEAGEFNVVVIFISDLNGLFYAYPKRKINAWTNDFATDNMGNRIKRLFEDEYALRVGRFGLGAQAATLGPRTRYDAFRNAGCTLEATDVRPWAGFVYARDTSMVCNEVVMGLYVRGMRHSTLRICYDPALI